MTAKPVLIFDFDGTLADTLGCLLKVVNQLADEFGYKKVEEKDVHRFRNQGAKELIKKLGIPFTELPLIAKKIRAGLAKEVKNFKPVDGIKEVLSALKKDGYVLGILSSNSGENVEAFLTRNKIDVFDFIYSGSSVFGKDKVIKRLLKNKNLSSKQVIYFGDEVRDIESARKVGVKIFAVAWGYNTAEVLKKHSPNHLVLRPRELISYLN